MSPAPGPNDSGASASMTAPASDTHRPSQSSSASQAPANVAGDLPSGDDSTSVSTHTYTATATATDTQTATATATATASATKTATVTSSATTSAAPPPPMNVGGTPPDDEDNDGTTSTSTSDTSSSQATHHPHSHSDSADASGAAGTVTSSSSQSSKAPHSSPTPANHQSHPFLPSSNSDTDSDPAPGSEQGQSSPGTSSPQPAGNNRVLGPQSTASNPTSSGRPAGNSEQAEKEDSEVVVNQSGQGSDESSPGPVKANAHLAVTQGPAAPSSPPEPASTITYAHSKLTTATSTFTTTLRSTEAHGHVVESTSTGTSTYTFAVPDLTSTSSPSSGHKPDLGAIIGGVIGGVVAFVLFLVLVCLVRRKRRGVVLDSRFTGRKSGDSIKARPSEDDGEGEAGDAEKGAGGRWGYGTIARASESSDFHMEGNDADFTDTDASLSFNPFWDPSEPPSARTSVASPVPNGSVRSKESPGNAQANSGSVRSRESPWNGHGPASSSVRVVEDGESRSFRSAEAEGASSVGAVENDSLRSGSGASRAVRNQISWYSDCGHERTSSRGSGGARVSRYSPAHRSRLSQTQVWGEENGEVEGGGVGEVPRPESLVSMCSSTGGESAVSREDSVSPSPPQFAPFTTPSPELVFRLPNIHIRIGDDADQRSSIASVDSGTTSSGSIRFEQPEHAEVLDAPPAETRSLHGNEVHVPKRIGLAPGSPSAASFGGRSVVSVGSRSVMSEGEMSLTGSWRGPNLENLVNHARRQTQQGKS
ncbi:hypothetical protein GLOTRDRAFT_123258 [Gloeophyllum trabeum ATCC 11539]|uniref:REJ domain-containing protein n=1 Tax=Gloeophyllum trabeum (strain ATCC 11539 / FP-39264 / Madison 617) TaxID=670483 RepID=S7PV38_GLOTA|nr:uncharacterized protein GLOTRDRAFT_123258 [Gloeophyllum trabeum ATCC 11539]EPQ51378.1 hypothetical protein GLOTRDRAFT_123258 [Gloeophyllum trabeum ATCC 11539]